jgi:hypothetical protein
MIATRKRRGRGGFPDDPDAEGQTTKRSSGVRVAKNLGSVGVGIDDEDGTVPGNDESLQLLSADQLAKLEEREGLTAEAVS